MIDEGMRALAEALRQQSAAYGFVARLLRIEVDDEALGRLRAMRFPAASGNDHLDAGYRGLCAYLNAGGERQHGDLAVDFLHTFIGVTQDREQVAFPYESVYTSPEHLLMQDARDEVLAAYRARRWCWWTKRASPRIIWRSSWSSCSCWESAPPRRWKRGTMDRARTFWRLAVRFSRSIC